MRINLLSLLLITIFIIINPSAIAVSKKSDNPVFSTVDQIFNTTNQWLHFPTNLNQSSIEFSIPIIIAAVLSFFAASISSAGGIGGGGLFISIMTIVAGLEMKTVSSFSAFMVTGVSFANVGCNIFVRNPKAGGKTLIDFDLALTVQPCLLLGVSVGVICNRMFPNWLVLTLFAVFLAWSTMKTCKKGVSYWNLETERAEIRKRRDDDGVEGARESLLGNEVEDEVEKGKIRFPWMKLGVLVIIWLLFFSINLLRGNKYGQGIISIQPCGALYWLLSSLQIPLTIFFTLCIYYSDNVQSTHTSHNQDPQKVQYITIAFLLLKVSKFDESETETEINPQEIGDGRRPNNLMLPIMALLAGVLGGLFGIGGGMLISPLLLQIGIAPEVTAATCSFIVLFSSTMSAIQYLLLGMEHAGTAAIFALICFVASLVGLMVVKKVIAKYGRASIIVFAVGIVMALSTVLMTAHGALNVWNDFVSGRYMGFKLPC
ncbi:Sulfite exporter TauE/SafE family protein 1 [Cardamine amara subsp. amara]|uniref:Sulfite exporter TauE/SafE family protein 1 n=1 Tax=Cardamine amara subsp. amara TaxID=228776 RepID=A0ABD0Z3T8_CARAN